MILDNFTEDEILKELIEDYTKCVRPAIKKTARKYLDYCRKSGTFIRDTQYDEHYMTSSLHNKWYVVIIYDMTLKSHWRSSSCCVVENSTYNSKDYYMLRRLNDQPYFIKVSAHVVKRLMERNNMHVLNMDYVPCFIFFPHETAVGLNYEDFPEYHYIGQLVNLGNPDNKLKVIITRRGIFYAHATEKRNFHFRTYISYEMVTEACKAEEAKGNWNKHKQSFYAYHGVVIHQYHNKPLYSKTELELGLYSFVDENAVMKFNSDPNKICLLEP